MYLGDFAANHPTVPIPFNTYEETSASPVSVSTFAAADVRIYKDGGATPRSSASGITLTNSFNSVIGQIMVLVDLSDNADSGFYAAGHEYSVSVVDDVNLHARKFIGAFSIERAGGALALIKLVKAKTDKLPTVALISCAVVEDALNSASTFKTNLSQTETNHFKDAFFTFTSGTLSGQTHRISAYDGGTKFITVATAFSAEPTAGDTGDIINK